MINLRSISFLLFFFSGFSALVYQVVWARQLCAIFGSSAESSAAVLAVFMAGMGIGGPALGRAADRIKNRFLCFAVIEGLIGLFGLLASSCFSVLESFYYSGGGASAGNRYMLAAVYMFIPCFLIGGTLPVLSRFCAKEDKNRFGLAAGGLYATNTFGAAAGALMAGFVFLESMGASGSIFLAAIINLVVAAACVTLYTAFKKQGMEPGRDEAAPPKNSVITNHASLAGKPGEDVHPPHYVARALIFSAFFLAGTSTMAHEVIWTRILSQFFRNSAYSFAAMLFAVLVGLAAGSGAGSLLSRRLRSNGYALGVAQMLAGLVSLSMVFFVSHFTELKTYGSWLQSFKAMESFGRFAAFESASALCLVFPPSFFMGLSFPLMARMAWRGSRRFGGFMGDLQFVLTAGSVVGAIGTALYLIPGDNGRFGLLNCIKCAACANILAAVLLWASSVRHAGKARLAAALSLLAAASLVYCTLPPDLRFWRDGIEKENLVFYTSDKIAEVAVVERPDGLVLKLNNTSGLGGTAGSYLETRIGMLPLILKGGSETALVMGLGTGNTLYGLLASGAKDVDCVELIPGVARASECFHPFSRDTLTGGNLRIFLDDARVFLRYIDRKYDLVIGDLYFPWQAETGFMYTKEHFGRVKDRLTEDGVFFQWLPLHQLRWEDFGIVGYTFSEVFEHVAVFLAAPDVGFPLVALAGSRKRLSFNPVSLQEQLDKHFRQAELKSLELDNAMAILPLYLGNEWRFRSSCFSETVVNTENRTLVEYRTARAMEDPAVRSFNNFRRLADPDFKEDAVPLLRFGEIDTEKKLKIEDEVRSRSRSLTHFMNCHILFLRESYFKQMGFKDDPSARRKVLESMGRESVSAFKLAPDYPIAEENLNRVWTMYINDHDYNAANNFAALVIDADPDNDAFYNKLGLGLILEEKYKEAVVCLTGAIFHNDMNFSARANLAIACFLKGDRVRAREEMSKVVDEFGYGRLSQLTAALAVLILEGRDRASALLAPFLESPVWKELAAAAIESAKESAVDGIRTGTRDEGP